MTFKFMKRTRIQTALAPLSDQEKETLAEWLRKEDYEDVHERVNKPRSDGGFGLSISLKPLRTFHAKVALLDVINSRLPENKKMTIAQFESINAGDVLLQGGARVSRVDSGVSPESSIPSTDPSIQSSINPSEENSAIENRQSKIKDEVHQAILEATTRTPTRPARRRKTGP